MLEKFNKYVQMAVEINEIMAGKYDMKDGIESTFVQYNQDRMADAVHKEAVRVQYEFEEIMEYLGFAHIEQNGNSDYYALDVNDELSLEAEFYYSKDEMQAYILLNVEFNGNVIKELNLSEKDVLKSVKHIVNNW